MDLFRHIKIILFSLLTIWFVGCNQHSNTASLILGDKCQYVKPLVGTWGDGNTYPGAQVPFGMVQVSPDTEKWDWGAASGYEYTDSTIYGFSMTHLHGTGIPDMGDILFMPTVGETHIRAGSKDLKEKGYLSSFSHEREEASPCYYSVVLDDYNIKAELTATLRSGMMRFTYPESDSAHIVLDLSHVLRHKVIWSDINVTNNTTISGMHQVKGWGKERYVFFAAEFSKPFKSHSIFSDGSKVEYDSYKTYRFRSSKEAAGPDIQFVADYSTEEGEQILVKVGISAVSTANALENLTAEIESFEFDQLVEQGVKDWNKELNKFQVKADTEDKETFYTAAYHSFMAPVIYTDVDNTYRGLDQNIHVSHDFQNYTLFSLWDTYRATHPLFCLVQPERNSNMINSMLAHYDQSVDSLLPIWSFWNNETWCMIGYHAVPVIVDAYFKDVKGVNWEKAYEACVSSATHDEFDATKEFEELGYVPYDIENESVSKTLEYAYDDYCIAMMAKDMGKEKDYQRFLKRAMGYQNLFDSEIGWMRPKDSKGNWKTPFDTYHFEHMGAFTEGTTWQYSWYVPQDVQGLVNLMGGNQGFESKLDSVFKVSNGKDYDGVDDIKGRIGEYWHGNEPSHHIAFLYNYIQKPWKTQKLIRHIMETQYGNTPEALCGNDDCGQMSAWYIFNAMGFYPVCPGSDYYAIGSPSFDEISMQLAEDKVLVIRANNQSDENVYVKSLTINGEAWNKSWISFDQIKDGGEIVFEMSSVPNKSWASDLESIPPSISHRVM